MRWLKWLCGSTGVVGALAGVLWPGATAESVAHKFEIWMQPPTSPDGLDSRLNCGYHAFCSNPATPGTGLDWGLHPNRDQEDEKKVYFRGFFKLSGHVDDLNELRAKPVDGGSGPDVCDRMYVDIWENNAAGNPVERRTRMNYLHMKLYNTNQFNIKVSDTPYWISTNIGKMTGDDNRVGCGTPWHVHEDHTVVTSSPPVSIALGAYPSGWCQDPCSYHINWACPEF
jgi:hypothetical protein